MPVAGLVIKPLIGFGGERRSSTESRSRKTPRKRQPKQRRKRAESMQATFRPAHANRPGRPPTQLRS
jgi:hypothetical protein